MFVKQQINISKTLNICVELCVYFSDADLLLHRFNSFINSFMSSFMTYLTSFKLILLRSALNTSLFPDHPNFIANPDALLKIQIFMNNIKVCRSAHKYTHNQINLYCFKYERSRKNKNLFGSSC